jgi:Flp pilus assembly pilin Flp
VTYTDLVTYFRARLSAEEGQTMAEYGVVLAVITLVVVLAITTLSGRISGAIDAVSAILPTG